MKAECLCIKIIRALAVFAFGLLASRAAQTTVVFPEGLENRIAGQPPVTPDSASNADLYAFRSDGGQTVPAAAGSAARPRKIVSITWKKGPNLPQGFQDSNGGIIGDTLVTVCGFCSGQTDVPGKAGKYPRGFLDRAWGLDLSHPANGWQELPPFPGVKRQGLVAMVVGDQLYAWGGISYSAPFCYRDGYRLSRRGNRWTWDTLPSLPWPVYAAGICAVGSRIYLMGGADYDGSGDGKFCTNGDRKGAIQRLGARLLVFDAEDAGAGWKELPACPGTPRFAHALAAVQGRLYVIGGASGNDNASGLYCTVVDNWTFAPATAHWQRLADTPVSTGNFPSGPIVFQDRYLLLVGGAQYQKILNPDGTLRPRYGTVTKHYPNSAYNSDILVFDTRTGVFGIGDPLPLCNNGPMTVVAGDTLHLLGGETGGFVLEGESFGHHPDLYLVGRLRALP